MNNSAFWAIRPFGHSAFWPTILNLFSFGLLVIRPYGFRPFDIFLLEVAKIVGTEGYFKSNLKLVLNFVGVLKIVLLSPNPNERLPKFKTLQKIIQSIKTNYLIGGRLLIT